MLFRSLAPGLVDMLRQTLQPCHAVAWNLYLEITESLLMEDLGHTAEVVKQLSDLGIRLAIDDFGTGYSSCATSNAFRWACSRSTARSSLASARILRMVSSCEP